MSYYVNFTYNLSTLRLLSSLLHVRSLRPSSSVGRGTSPPLTLLFHSTPPTGLVLCLLSPVLLVPGTPSRNHVSLGPTLPRPSLALSSCVTHTWSSSNVTGTVQNNQLTETCLQVGICNCSSRHFSLFTIRVYRRNSYFTFLYIYTFLQS